MEGVQITIFLENEHHIIYFRPVAKHGHFLLLEVWFVAIAEYVSVHQKYAFFTPPQTVSLSLKDRHLFDVVTEKKKSP
jgi:hypothetical protein